MSSFPNSKRDRFLLSRDICSLEDDGDKLTERCKFNFHYFTVQAAGQDFGGWNQGELVDLLSHLKDYSNFSLIHWTRQPIGKSGTVLIMYDKFPTKTAFTYPKHIPHQARWGRFRLTHAKRLVGFTVPKELDGKEHPRTGVRFCANTFYVVFLDAGHKFWQSEPK